MPLLSLLTVTKAEPHALVFIEEMLELVRRIDGQLVIAADGQQAYDSLDLCFNSLDPVKLIQVNSAGYLESVHDHAVAHCDGTYVLRLDDDERCSLAMVNWLLEDRFLSHPHWKFPRMALWGSDEFYITNSPLWPDHQTRLSLKHMAVGRDHIHAGSPFGGGEVAPVAIEHHKFLVKSRDMREEIADRYDRIQMGAGRNGMAAFQLPEDVFGEEISLAEVGYGHV